jgi:hypothetical protein
MLSLFNSGKSTKHASLQFLNLHGMSSQYQQLVLVSNGSLILLEMSVTIAAGG